MNFASHQNRSVKTEVEQSKPRLIAFYLTQFHPTPENDLWWGKGFTEWTNVTKAGALFSGHYQPHLPSDFGFYDLRVRDTRHDQIKTAKQYGIDGFCYHYYWFSGKRILNAPLDDMLIDEKSDMPFCLCWANENWTRRWDAAEHEILIAQKYAENDDLNFIKSLIPFFKDSRYIKVDEAPFLIVYRPQHLPNAAKSLEIWRDYCMSVGIPKVHIVCALTHGNLDYEQYGFDGGVEFPPHNLSGVTPVANVKFDFKTEFTGLVCQYSDIANTYLERKYNSSNVFKTVFPSWDNTARTGSRALITINGTPSNYEYWLAQTILKTQVDHPKKDRLIFINAWNEWAEGCHLEPDREYGHGFLEATLKAKNGISTLTAFPDVDLPKQQLVNSINLEAFATNLTPIRLTTPCSNWMLHAPFVAWLVKITNPQIIVELGTLTDGNSFCILNQAAKEYSINTKVYGFSSLQISENDELQTYLSEAYPGAKLVRDDLVLSQAVNQFEDGAVDILHFHDMRSAEQLRSLLQKWRIKLSEKAVVLVHNSNWHGSRSDAYLFWEEVQSSAPSFHFLDSHGLGVLLIGNSRKEIQQIMNDVGYSDSVWMLHSSIFVKAGKQIEQRLRYAELKQEATNLKHEVTALRSSKSWRLTSPLRSLLKTML
jgi:hypothetical protein